MTLTPQQLGFDLPLDDRVFLLAANGTRLEDAVRVHDHPQARAAEYDGRWLVPDQVTPGTPNLFSLEQDIVINEILYHAPGTATSGVPATYETTRLVSIDDLTIWRYRAENEGLSDGWASVAHPTGTDSWQEGPALIGYERSELPEPMRTELPNPVTIFPPITTYYFEHDFEYTGNPADQEAELAIRHLIDDGAVFYLNGHEILRFNLPAGPIDSGTTATPSVNNAEFSDAIPLGKEYLRQGTNRLSVEVHQASVASNDIAFGVELLTRKIVDPGIPAQPFEDSNEEWIELYNRSPVRAVDLSGWRLDDAVAFDFAPGTQLAPQQYGLIVADAASFNETYPQLAAMVVGEFRGSLSNRDETLRLLDASGNPADEVHYFDEGRWSYAADGGGASLELVDAFADNGQPEAWSASHEADNSQWQTITYRDIVRPDGFTNNITTRYHELILGMLDAGIVLIDDVSVIEDPDRTAIQRVQNGQFESDSLQQQPAHWRIAGNHSGIVVADPDDPQNHVLQLTASGSLEDRYNHAETTFVDNVPLREGVTYEISFCAKWIQGSNQLNSHLYFDRLSRTSLLDRPLHVGTPGQPNSSAVENIGPTFANLQHTPVVPAPNEPVVVSIQASDPQNVAGAVLWYAVEDGDFQSLPMSQSASGDWTATIPGQSASDVVQFYVEASDGLAATATFPAGGTDSRALFRVQDQQAREGIHNFRIVMTPADTKWLHERTNVMSNGRIGATVIYNESEVFYDVGVRLKGSNAGRSNAPYLGFNVAFDPTHLFRGVHDSVAIDRSGRSSSTPLTQDEILIKHIGNHAGDIPYMYDDLVHVIAPNRIHSRTALLMMARYGNEFFDSQFANGSDGTTFRLDIAYVPDRTTDGKPESPKVPFPYSHPQPTKDLQDLGDDKELYRARADPQ